MKDKQVIVKITQLANMEKSVFLKRFFKTGQGQYGEGDQFLGLTVPQVRGVGKEFYKEIDLESLAVLIASPYHEIRLVALIMLTYKFPKASESEKKLLYEFYLENKKYVNNWDLVDLSADKVMGAYLMENLEKVKILDELTSSDNLWDRRIGVLASFAFIKNNQFDLTLRLVEKLLNDKQDLMHKACGWMLREIGKRDESELTNFLDKHYARMPRTMLRYSIERLSLKQKTHYMKKVEA